MEEPWILAHVMQELLVQVLCEQAMLEEIFEELYDAIFHEKCFSGSQGENHEVSREEIVAANVFLELKLIISFEKNILYNHVRKFSTAYCEKQKVTVMVDSLSK